MKKQPIYYVIFSGSTGKVIKSYPKGKVTFEKTGVGSYIVTYRP